MYANYQIIFNFSVSAVSNARKRFLFDFYFYTKEKQIRIAITQQYISKYWF